MATYRTPADPWAGRTGEVPVVLRRRVIGRVYELILADRSDDRDTYVGKTEGTIHQRVHGKQSSAHTSSESVAKDPWKARILPGRAGYRLLENVYDTGSPAENDCALRRAEAWWIQRMNPRHNDVRPVKPVGQHARATPVRPAVRRTARPRRSIVKPLALLVLVALFTYLSARVLVAMQLPWPAAPWVGAPGAGVILGWYCFEHSHRAARRARRKVLGR